MAATRKPFSKTSELRTVNSAERAEPLFCVLLDEGGFALRLLRVDDSALALDPGALELKRDELAPWVAGLDERLGKGQSLVVAPWIVVDRVEERVRRGHGPMLASPTRSPMLCRTRGDLRLCMPLEPVECLAEPRYDFRRHRVALGGHVPQNMPFQGLRSRMS